MAPRTNPATTALRMLLDALNDENDEEFQEAIDNLSDEIERGQWPDALVAAKEFLGAGAEETATAPQVFDPSRDDGDGEGGGDDNWSDDP